MHVHLLETVNKLGVGAYRRRWACKPPLTGESFKITESHWNADCTLQTVTRWEQA